MISGRTKISNLRKGGSGTFVFCFEVVTNESTRIKVGTIYNESHSDPTMKTTPTASGNRAGCG